MLTDELFKRRIIGAVNSYIRLINSTADNESEEIISSQWKSHLENSGNTFVATIKVNGYEEKLFFAQNEWKSLNEDIFKNKKLKNLLKRFSL